MDERLDEWQALARPEYSVPILEELEKSHEPGESFRILQGVLNPLDRNDSEKWPNASW
jgi:hypothetical protein